MEVVFYFISILTSADMDTGELLRSLVILELLKLFIFPQMFVNIPHHTFPERVSQQYKHALKKHSLTYTYNWYQHRHIISICNQYRYLRMVLLDPFYVCI